jgi:flavin reductase ActVB
MSRFASGVTVTTARRADGVPAGMTVSSFTSLSLDPPLVLVCIARNALGYPVYAGSSQFAVSILSASQSELAVRYATPGGLKFAPGDTIAAPVTGLPVLRGALGHIECARHDLVPAGDHAILIGQVLDVAFRDGDPLIHYRGALCPVSPVDHQVTASVNERGTNGALCQ